MRTFAYVGIALAGCLVIGYPVAYYLARYARRTKTLLLVLLIVPFWVSYLMRMLAWVGLLLPDGLVNRTLIDLGILSQPYGWLDGQASSVIFALIYGYVPYLILPLYATLDRIEPNVLEAGRDLGASPIRTFIHVTLPLSRLRPARRERPDRAADVRRLLHERRHLGLAAHDHDRQRDQPVLPGRAAAHGRCMSRDRAFGGARRADVVLPLDHGARVAHGGRRYEARPRLVGEPVGPAARPRRGHVGATWCGRSYPS